MINGLKPDFVLAFVLLDVAIILIAARAFGALAIRLRQPRVVGEIVAGIMLGPSLLGVKALDWTKSWSVLRCDASRAWMPVGADPAKFVERPESISNCLFPAQSQGVLSVIGQLALVFFMFLVGSELRFDVLKGRVSAIMTMALGVILVPLGLGLVIGPMLHNNKFALATPEGALPSATAFSLFLAAILAVTAFPVMARILQEKGLTQSAMGAIGVAAAAVVTVLMFMLFAVAKGVNADQSLGGHSKVFIGTALYLGIMFGVVRPLLRPVGARIAAAGKLDATWFVGAIILAIVSAYVADRIGINVIVGGFVAGAVMPNRELVFAELSSRLSEITASVLLPIFLAFSGLRTDFTSLGWSWAPGIVLFLVAGIVGKWGGGALAARLGGLTWAEGNVLGVLMNCRGLLVLVVALAAFDTKVITPQMQVGAVLMALITTAMTGPLFDRFLPAATRSRAQEPPPGERLATEGAAV
jgi:Kef-type K+ transport system membrane component KefB